MAELHIMGTAPDFSLPDQGGETVRLSDYRGAKNIILVFNRSLG
jgi:peroxiredoxin